MIRTNLQRIQFHDSLIFWSSSILPFSFCLPLNDGFKKKKNSNYWRCEEWFDAGKKQIRWGRLTTKQFDPVGHVVIDQKPHSHKANPRDVASPTTIRKSKVRTKDEKTGGKSGKKFGFDKA